MHVLHNRVEEALNIIRPYLEEDGGNVEIVEITDDNIVRVELTGACKTCSMSHMTMKAGIEEIIRKTVPEITAIESVTL